MKALIVTGSMVQDHEFIYPYHRLIEAGYDVTVAAEGSGEFRGIQGVKCFANVDLATEAEVVDDYDVLIIPGGVKCMEHLRLSQAALHIIAVHHKRGRVIGAICSGAQMLISAGLVKGRTISGYPAIQIDIENAGGEFINRVACSKRIVTAPHYRDLGPWMYRVLVEVSAWRAKRVS